MYPGTTNAIQQSKVSTHLGNLKLYLAIIILLILSYTNIVTAQNCWINKTLTTTCTSMGAASLGSKVFLAGGTRGPNNQTSNIVDIYDVNSQQWTTSLLSVGRSFPSGVSLGGKVFFAGGMDYNNGLAPVSEVDIYDVVTQSWDTAQLSQARFGGASVAYGSKVIFAGGVNLQTMTNFANVDIYDTITGVWSTTSLSEARGGMGFAVAGTKAFFAGGFNLTSVTNKVDIYDFNTGIWTTDTLSLARGFVAATTVGNKIIIAGGMTASNIPTTRVDIYDVSTDTWQVSDMSFPRCFLENAASANGKAFFAGGGTVNLNTQLWTSTSDVVDCYDPINNIWYVDHIPNHDVIFHAVVSNGDFVYVAGGQDATAFNTFDILNAICTGIDDQPNEATDFSIYPNPANDLLTINYPQLVGKEVTTTIIDITGKIIYQTTTNNSQKVEVNTNDFAEGMYMVHVNTSDFAETKKVIVTK